MLNRSESWLVTRLLVQLLQKPCNCHLYAKLHNGFECSRCWLLELANKDFPDQLAMATRAYARTQAKRKAANNDPV